MITNIRMKRRHKQYYNMQTDQRNQKIGIQSKKIARIEKKIGVASAPRQSLEFNSYQSEYSNNNMINIYIDI